MGSSAEQPAGAFWEDLKRNLQDDKFRHHYHLAARRIAAVDALVNDLDARREACGWSKAQLARAVDKSPESIRRLLTVENPNPTLGTFVELATVLGLKIKVEPMTDEERGADYDDGAYPPGQLASN